jgi:uncharacterized protein
MTSPEFTFPVADLDAGGKSFQRPVRVGWLRGVLEGTDVGASDHDGALDLRLSKSGTDVVVRGTLSADLVVPCSRCLEPAVVPIREELSALAVPGAEPRRSGDEGDDGEEDTEVEQADIIGFDGETLILDELVRDELLLGIPMIPLCSEACPGIRPERSGGEGQPEGVGQPGDEGEEAIDPRLRPLLKLRNKT